MNFRTRTIASFFTVAMAAMLFGALVTTHVQRPEIAQARPAELAATQTRGTDSIGLDTFRDIARRSMPGVVNINTSKVIKRQRSNDPLRNFFGDDMFDRFFGPGGGAERQTQRSLGSGFVIDKDGYVLTNRHVVNEADEIQVTLKNGKTYDAKLIGKDARTDVALVKIEAKEQLTVLEMGDSDKAEVAEWVMAIGSPFGLGHSATVGVVSFNGRSLSLQQGTGVDMIQTDAAINPGNSGGPLINARGQVIGINTLIFTQGAPQSAGVGFAVPINVAKEILPQLREKGKVVRGWLGLQIQNVDQDMAKNLKLGEVRGALVSDVTEGSPAEKAGIKPGDVVLTVDGRRIGERDDLSRYVASRAPGTTVKLTVWRDGSDRPVSVTLGTFPEESERSDSEQGRAGKLGMTLRDLTPEVAQRLELPRNLKGVVVMSVEPGDAAERAGLQQGDVIVNVNGNGVTDVNAFEAEIAKAKPEGGALLRVRRGGSYLFTMLQIK